MEDETTCESQSARGLMYIVIFSYYKKHSILFIPQFRLNNGIIYGPLLQVGCRMVGIFNHFRVFPHSKSSQCMRE